MGKETVIEQSSVVPYLEMNGETHLVLITSHSSGSWIIPKGLVEPDLTPAESAAKEAMEEAGVAGVTGEDVVAVYRYEKWGGVCEVQVFTLAVSEILDQWDEMHSRNRVIVPFSEALDMVKNDLKPVLEAFADIHNR